MVKLDMCRVWVASPCLFRKKILNFDLLVLHIPVLSLIKPNQGQNTSPWAWHCWTPGLVNLVSFNFDQPPYYVRHPFSIYGQTFSKSYSKHLFMYSFQYSLFYPLVSSCKTSSLRAAFSFQELSISLMKCFRICQLFVDVDKLRSVQVHHPQHVPGHVQ